MSGGKGEVPEGWESKTLGELGKWRGGGTPSKANPEFWLDGSIPWVSPKDMKSTYISNAEDFITEEAVKNSATSLIDENSLLMVTRSGILRHSFPVGISMRTVAINQDIKALIPNKKYDTVYLANVLWGFEKDILEKCQKDGTTVESIDFEALKAYRVNIPPLPEQIKIATILSTWDDSLTTLARLLEAKRQQKRGLAEALLTGKKRLKGFEGEWEEKKLGEIADFTAGATPSTSRKEYWGGEIPWMASGDIHKKRVWEVEGRITELGLKSSSTKMLPKNSVLVALAGQGKTRGTVATNAIELCTNQSIAAIIPGDRLNWEYLFANLDSRYEELRSLSTGDGGRGGLNLGILRTVEISLPPLPEQQAIASILSTLDAEIASLEALRGKVQEQKRGLMDELLTGRVRVKVEGA